jgi:hypothetical protein
MARVLIPAIRSGATSEIKNAIREIYLVGQNRDDELNDMIEGALYYKDFAFLKAILGLQDPYVNEPSKFGRRLVDVNKLPVKLMVFTTAYSGTEEILKIFLEAG